MLGNTTLRGDFFPLLQEQWHLVLISEEWKIQLYTYRAIKHHMRWIICKVAPTGLGQINQCILSHLTGSNEHRGFGFVQL